MDAVSLSMCAASLAEGEAPVGMEFSARVFRHTIKPVRLQPEKPCRVLGGSLDSVGKSGYWLSVACMQACMLLPIALGIDRALVCACAAYCLVITAAGGCPGTSTPL